MQLLPALMGNGRCGLARIGTRHEMRQTVKKGDAYPSNYLKADEDVPDQSEGGITLTINEVKMETLGQGKDAQDKPIVYFNEIEKGLVLNKTNWGLAEKALGTEETDEWTGRRITLYSTDVQFGADMVRGIRISSRAPKVKPNGTAGKPAATCPVPAKAAAAAVTEDADDPAPF